MQSLKNDRHLLTVITPTIGRDSLQLLIQSLDTQTIADRIFHILLWDETQVGTASPESFNAANRYSMVIPWGLGRNGHAPGSSLRSVGLMAANTYWVTFADDDVHWEQNHAELLVRTATNYNWAACLRNIYDSAGNYLGVDRFESVGDDPGRLVDYEMVDNNCLIFSRALGTQAAHLYRQTKNYDDDRLFYAFMKQHAGPLGRTNQATINQVCPDRLIDFFAQNCSAA